MKIFFNKSRYFWQSFAQSFSINRLHASLKIHHYFMHLLLCLLAIFLLQIERSNKLSVLSKCSLRFVPKNLNLKGSSATIDAHTVVLPISSVKSRVCHCSLVSPLSRASLWLDSPKILLELQEHKDADYFIIIQVSDFKTLIKGFCCHYFLLKWL